MIRDDCDHLTIFALFIDPPKLYNLANPVGGLMDELVNRVGWESRVWLGGEGRRGLPEGEGRLPGGEGWVGEVVRGTGGVHIVVHVQVQSAKVVRWRVSVFKENRKEAVKHFISILLHILKIVTFGCHRQVAGGSQGNQALEGQQEVKEEPRGSSFYIFFI